MGKIEKVFKNGEVLFAEDLNPIVKQVNDNVDDIASNARAIVGLGQTQQTQGETIQTQGEAIQTMSQAIGALVTQGYKFAGVAALSEDPGTPAMSVFKIASAVGSYANYGLEVTQQDGVCAFLYDKSAAEPAWAKLALGIAFPAPAGMVLDSVQTGTITAQSNHYYNVVQDVDTLAVTLPTPIAGISSTIKIHFYAGANVTTSFIGGNTPVRVLIPSFKSRHEYVLTINYDGHAWNVTGEDLLPRTDCLTFRSAGAFSLRFSVKNWEGVLEYSTNGKTWQNVSVSQTMNAVNDGHRYTLYLRGTGNSTLGDPFEPIISMTGENVDCLGNIMTLLDYQHISDTLTSNYAFAFLFCNCSSLRTAPELPATTLSAHCYYMMFTGSGLTAAPALPATTLADSCYTQMFMGCENLTEAPSLPATTLAERCYAQMFAGSGLTASPTLPAATLVTRCYMAMFDSCSSLSDITMLATDVQAEYCLTNWVYGVAENGTFHKAAAMGKLPIGTDGIPEGWQVVDA